MHKILNDKYVSKIIKTFIEGFLASLIVSFQTIENLSDLNLIKTVLVGAIAMGISAVLNLFQMYLNKEKVEYGKSNT
ncbi:MAG: hypothetical protein E7169_01770 [Firmicutes bacterium]|nr:hypothetical protein [Bacillota bacterium]